MQTLMEVLREIIGEPEFYVKLGTSTNYSWDYGAMLEYGACVIIICVIIICVFKYIRAWVK